MASGRATEARMSLASVDLRRVDGVDSGTDLEDELAWCLARFVAGIADEPTMDRARLALARHARTAPLTL